MNQASHQARLFKGAFRIGLHGITENKQKNFIDSMLIINDLSLGPEKIWLMWKKNLAKIR